MLAVSTASPSDVGLVLYYGDNPIHTPDCICTCINVDIRSTSSQVKSCFIENPYLPLHDLRAELLDSTRPSTDGRSCINIESLVSQRLWTVTLACSSTCSQRSGVQAYAAGREFQNPCSSCCPWQSHARSCFFCLMTMKGTRCQGLPCDCEYWRTRAKAVSLLFFFTVSVS